MALRIRIIIAVVLLAGIVSGIIFYSAASPGKDADHNLAGSPGVSSRSTESGVVLSELARSKVAITSQDQLATELTRASRRSLTPHVDANSSDINDALKHVSELLWYRFYRQDSEGYRSWRMSHGYEPPSADRSAAMNMRADAGLHANDASPVDWYSTIWSRRVAGSRQPVGLSDAENASVVVTGILKEPVPIDPALAHVRPFPHLLSKGTTDKVTFELSKQRVGSGWPFWLPPQHVLERISRPGTQIVEVRVVPIFADNDGDTAAALSLVLARDATTGSWWIVQFFAFDLSAPGTAYINAHLL
jgi:hypothetical protein